MDEPFFFAAALALLLLAAFWLKADDIDERMQKVSPQPAGMTTGVGWHGE
jgi:hypothetical protein